jgi:hypothetical protein
MREFSGTIFELAILVIEGSNVTCTSNLQAWESVREETAVDVCN